MIIIDKIIVVVIIGIDRIFLGCMAISSGIGVFDSFAVIFCIGDSFEEGYEVRGAQAVCYEAIVVSVAAAGATTVSVSSCVVSCLSLFVIGIGIGIGLVVLIRRTSINVLLNGYLGCGSSTATSIIATSSSTTSPVTSTVLVMCKSSLQCILDIRIAIIRDAILPFP